MLASALFGGDIFAMNAKFILTLEIEAKLTVCNDAITSPPDDYPVDLSPFATALSDISFGDTIYTIATGAIQGKEAQERMAAAI